MQVGSLIIDLRADIARLQSDMDKANRTVGGAMQKIERQAKLAMNAIGGIVGAIGVRELAQAADSYTKLTAQLKLATRSADEYAQAYSNVQRVARSAQADLSATAQVYARLSNALRDTGASQRLIADVSETVTLALRVNGASAAETTSAMLQLSQAFGKGKLDGDEFRTAMEAAPPLMRKLAESMGVPFGALKDLAAQGKITQEAMLKAWTDPAYLAGLREQVKEVATISSAITVLKNNFITMLGEFDKAQGVSKNVSNVILTLADNLQYLIGVIGSLVAGRFVQYLTTTAVEMVKVTAAARAKAMATLEAARADEAAKLAALNHANARVAELRAAIAATEGYVQLEIATNGLIPANARATAAANAHAASLTALSNAQKAASVTSGAVGSAIALLGGPIGSIITVLGLATTAWFMFGNAAEQAAMKNASAADRALMKLNQLKEQQLIADANNNPIAVELEEAAKKYAQAVSNVRDAANIHGVIVKTGTSEVEQARIELEKVTERFKEAEKLIGKQSGASFTSPAVVDEKAQKAALKPEELRHKQILDDLQKEIDFEEDMRETRDRMAYEEREKARKELEKSEKERAELIKKRNQEISDEYLRTVKEQNEKAQREYERMFDSISQSLTDALLRGFESGKDFAQNFKDTLINMFKTLVLRPVIQAIVSPVAGAITSAIGLGGISGTALAGGAGSVGGIGGLSGIGSNLLTVGKGLINGISGVQDAITSSIQKLGVMLANGNGGLLDSIGGFLGANAGTIGNVLPFAGAAFQALTGNIKGAAFTAAGAAIGSIVPGLGTALGGAIGGIVGSVFGGKKKIPRVGAYVGGMFQNGAFRQTGIDTWGSKFNAAAVDPLNSLNQQFATNLGTLLSAFGLNGNVFSASGINTKSHAHVGFNATFQGGQVSLNEEHGKDVQAAFQYLVDQVMGPLMVQAIRQSKLPAGIKSLFAGISDKATVQKMISAAASLSANQQQLTKVYDLTADSAAKVGRATGATGDALITLLDKLTTAANSYKTVGDVLVESQTSLVGSLKLTNPNSLPGTLKAFDDMLKSIDTSSSAGIKQFADLFMVRDQFAAYRQSVDTLKGGVRGALFGMVSPAEQQTMQQEDLAKMFAELGRAVPGSVQELIDLGKSIDYTTKEGLDLAAVFPQLVQAFQQTTIETNALIDSLGQLDINKFRSLFDYTRASAYLRNGISLSQLPSYDVGTSYVPQTGPAMIHQGERIMTASENRDYSNAMGMMVQEIRMLRQDNASMRAELQSIALSTYKSAASVDRLERDGMIIRDVDQNGDVQIVKVEVVTP